MSAQEYILHFPLGGKIYLAANEWQVWGGQDEDTNSKPPDLDQDSHKVLVPFSWWRSHFQEHQQNSDVLAKAKNGQIGIWFAADDDILKHADIIEAGKKVWPLVAAHFPIFRDGRSFSTAAILRDRLGWDKEIRMIGDVLIDQLLQGARVGFDSFELRPDQDLAVAQKQFDLFSVTTQNSWRAKRTLMSVLQ